MQNLIFRKRKQLFPREYLALKIKILKKATKSFQKRSLHKLREIKYLETLKKLSWFIYTQTGAYTSWSITKQAAVTVVSSTQAKEHHKLELH